MLSTHVRPATVELGVRAGYKLAGLALRLLPARHPARRFHEGTLRLVSTGSPIEALTLDAPER